MDKVGDGRYGGANRAFRSADGSQPYLLSKVQAQAAIPSTFD